MVVLGPRRLGDVGSRLFCLYPFFFFFFLDYDVPFPTYLSLLHFTEGSFFIYLVLPLTHHLNMYCFFFFDVALFF